MYVGLSLSGIWRSKSSLTSWVDFSNLVGFSILRFHLRCFPSHDTMKDLGSVAKLFDSTVECLHWLPSCNISLLDAELEDSLFLCGHGILCTASIRFVVICLSVCTILYACTFDLWYIRHDVLCKNAYSLAKSLNSLLAYWAQLSDTNSSGIPCLKKIL